jgi:hypothetical protein
LADTVLQVLLRKLISKKPKWLHCQCVHELLATAKCPLVPSRVHIVCRIVTGVYFSVG